MNNSIEETIKEFDENYREYDDNYLSNETFENMKMFIRDKLTYQHETDKAFYEGVLEKVIGADEEYEKLKHTEDLQGEDKNLDRSTRNELRAEQRARAYQLISEKGETA